MAPLMLAVLLCAAAAWPASAANAKAPSPGSGTDAACCARLAAINFQTPLPVVIVDAGPAGVTRNKTTAQLCTCSNGLPHGDLSSSVTIHVRGGTDSQLRNQILQYAIKLDTKKWFLGMPKSRNWLLYAQQLDPFALHEWLGFHLGSGTGEYTPRTQFCELFVIDDGKPLNSQQHYRGIYLGLESINQELNRVDIAKNNNTADVTGGYILEYAHGENPKGLPTANGSVSHKQWLVSYPKKGVTAAQVAYIQGYLNSFEQALYGPTFTDPAKGWRQFADEGAFVDWFLAIELIRNAKHSYHSSAFLTKDAGKPFVMGPVWDNVQGFGTCCGYPVKGYDSDGNTPINPASGGNGITPSGWLFSVCLNGYCPALDATDPGYGIATWFQQLWKDPTWVAACARRWAQLRAGPWATAAVTASLDSMRSLLDAAAVRTLGRWPSQLRQAQYYPTAEAQFQGVMSQLQAWLTQRLAWMDGAFQQAVQPGQANGPFPATYPGTGAQAPAANLATAGK